MTPNPTMALALEQLMLHPRYSELLDRLRAATPVAVADQVDAASRDAHAFMTTGAAVLGSDGVRTVAPDALPGWLRLGILDTLTTWTAGGGRTCAHNPTPTRPAPVLAAAWRPGLVVCADCPHLISLRRGSAADRVCDACGHQCAGVEHDDGIYPGMVQLGPLVYQYGVCAGCQSPQ